MWTWKIASGELLHDGELIARGYCGRDHGKNNPGAQGMPGVGPIPVGKWRMVRLYDSPNVGPRAIELDANDTHPGDDRHEGTGRGAFRIHGDSIAHPGTASHGCIILDRATRLKIWTSGDRLLEVVA